MRFNFLTKSQGGLTRKVREYLLDKRTETLTTFVEGPYGVSKSFDIFPSVLFISGGVAISFTMSHLIHLLQTKAQTPASPVQRVHHVWLIREEANIEWIRQELHQISDLALPHGLLKMSFYITTETEGGIVFPDLDLGNGEVEMFHHRAKIKEILAEEAQDRLGRLAVVGMLITIVNTNFSLWSRGTG